MFDYWRHQQQNKWLHLRTFSHLAEVAAGGVGGQVMPGATCQSVSSQLTPAFCLRSFSSVLWIFRTVSALPQQSIKLNKFQCTKSIQSTPPPTNPHFIFLALFETSHYRDYNFLAPSWQYLICVSSLASVMTSWSILHPVAYRHQTWGKKLPQTHSTAYLETVVLPN